MKPNFYWDIPQHIFDPADPYNFQTNEEWLALRADRLTASFAKDLLADEKGSTGLGKVIKKRIGKRIMQRYSGWIDDECMSWAEKENVRRGIVFEPEARARYSAVPGFNVTECGYVERGSYIGCSPDGLVLEHKRNVQIKIPAPENYVACVSGEWKEYEKQCKMELFVCDNDVSDLVIYSPELQAGEIISIKRDPAIDAKILSKTRLAVKYQEESDKTIRRILEQKEFPNFAVIV